MRVYEGGGVMVGAISNALTGYKAATERLNVSAENLANQFSTARVENGKVTNEPYVPQTVQAISQEEGGVATRVVDKEAAFVKRFNPDSPNADANGLEDVPNVDTAEEAVNQVIASYDARANLKIIKVEDEIIQSALDIFT